MKSPEDLSKEQLISDLAKLRSRVIELEKIAQDKAELSRAKAMFEGLFEFAPDAMVVVNREGLIVQVNKQAEKLFGYTREELLQMKHDTLVPERYTVKHKEDRAGYMLNPRVRQMGTGLELYGRKKDESEFPVDIALGPLQTTGDFVVVAVVRDFTERKRAEENLRRALADMKTANEELESFSYSVSHDLRSPLRAIDGFCRMLVKDLKDKLDDESLRKLDVISSNAQKMGQLIDDLLHYSRASRTALSFDTIDMRGLADDVWKEIHAGNSDRSMELKMGDLVPAFGNMPLVKQILSNLLGNAVKFTREREHAIIEVTSSNIGGFNSYCIRDNGIGFDMIYYYRLFEIFHRLHSEKEYEGTGIGLAIVKKIVERHGGKIWAESRLGQGASFYFTLPAGV